MASTNAALDRLKAHAAASQAELVGFSLGGAVAVLAAAQRSDVRDPRTVAAYLDTAMDAGASRLLTGSLDPVSVAPLLTNVPQLHFASGSDRVVDVSVIRSYAAASGPAACLRVVLIPDMEHGDDWIDPLSRLLKVVLPVDCHTQRNSAATR